MIVVLLAACSDPQSVEAIIGDNIEQMQEAVESKSADDLLQHVFDGFSSAKGYDKNGLQRILLFYQLRHQRITTLVTNLEIDIAQSGVAKARFNILLTGGAGLLPEQGGFYQVETDWRQEQGAWRLVYADWHKP